MKYFITLLLILATITGLQAKEVALEDTNINNSELCEIFTGKVEDYTKYTSHDEFKGRTLHYFETRQKEHCKN